MKKPILASLLAAAMCLPAVRAAGPVKVFVLAGDEGMLRQGSIDGVPRELGKRGANPAEPAAKPGTLLGLMVNDPRFGFLKDADGKWAARVDVALFDAHPLSNNRRSPARLLQVPADPADPLGFGVGPELMFGHLVGERFDDPVLLIRFAIKHPIWFRRGSRSLGYDYLPPSGGGGLDLDGGWDVIHFNHGVWDQQYVDPGNPDQRAEPGQGRVRTTLEDYEKNLRAIVARLRQTKATLIWAHTTPILEGTPPGYVGGELVDRYNAVAAQVMHDNGVIIDDLNAECRRMGKHPEFNGNVATVDTIPFYLPKEQSPGGREWDYHNNAGSFLRIGEAMGKEMLGLIR